MRIITVNLPESYLKAMDKLLGEKAIYPSRSELIRVAVREFLIKELEAVKSFSDFQQRMDQHVNKPQNNTSETFIQVPMDSDEIIDGSSEKYRTYRIIKK
jgi:Arc/MetJ-type ribon-helix-helix transcriptional regulator